MALLVYVLLCNDRNFILHTVAAQPLLYYDGMTIMKVYFLRLYLQVLNKGGINIEGRGVVYLEIVLKTTSNLVCLIVVLFEIGPQYFRISSLIIDWIQSVFVKHGFFVRQRSPSKSSAKLLCLQALPIGSPSEELGLVSSCMVLYLQILNEGRKHIEEEEWSIQRSF